MSQVMSVLRRLLNEEFKHNKPTSINYTTETDTGNRTYDIKFDDGRHCSIRSLNMKYGSKVMIKIKRTKS